MSASIVNNAKMRVSSVLNRDVKQFGKKYLTDQEEDTCWNSDQGSPQWILLEFEEKVNIKEIHLQFQGGFAGKDCCVLCSSETTDLSELSNFYPEDVNSVQIFPVSDASSVKTMKILFNSSTDFYGRITIYKLDIIGEVS